MLQHQPSSESPKQITRGGTTESTVQKNDNTSTYLDPKKSPRKRILQLWLSSNPLRRSIPLDPPSPLPAPRWRANWSSGRAPARAGRARRGLGGLGIGGSSEPSEIQRSSFLQPHSSIEMSLHPGSEVQSSLKEVLIQKALDSRQPS